MPKIKLQSPESLKNLTRRIIFFTGTLVAIAITLNMVIDNPWMHSFISHIINDKLKKEYDIQLHFRSMEVSAIPLGFTIYGFKINHLDNNKKILEGSQLSGTMNIISLFLGQPKLDNILINELKIDYTKLNQPADHPASKDERTSWPPSYDLPLNQIELQNASISYRSKSSNSLYTLSLKTSGLDLTLDYDSWQEFTIDIDSRMTNFVYEEANLIQNGHIKGTLEMKGSQLGSKELFLASTNLNSKIDLKAIIQTESVQNSLLTATKFNDEIIKSIDMHLNLKIHNSSLDLLGEYLDVPETDGGISGKTQVKIAIPFDKNEVTWGAYGDATIQNGRIDGFKLYDSHFKFVLDRKKIDFPSITLGKEKVIKGIADGSILFSDPLTFNFKTSFRGMTSTELLNALQVENFNLIDGQLYSEKTAISGSGSPFSMTISGDVLLKGLNTPTLNYHHKTFPSPPDCHINLELFSDATSISFENTSANCVDHLNDPPLQILSKKSEMLDKGTSLSHLKFDGRAWYDSKKGIDLAVSSNEMDIKIAQYFSQLDQDGVATFKTKIKGPYDDISVTTQFSAYDTNISGFPLGSIDGLMTFNINEEAIRFPNVKINPDEGGILRLYNSKINLDDSITSDIYFLGKGIDKSVIKDGFDYLFAEHTINFSIDELSGHLTGPIRKPLRYQGSIKMNLRDGHLSKEKVFDNLNGEISFKTKSIKTESLTYDLGDFKSNIHISYAHRKQSKNNIDWLTDLGGGWDDWLELKISSKVKKNHNGDDLSNLPFAGKYLKDIGIEGDLSIDLQTEGTIKRQQGTFELGIQNPTILHNQISPLRLKGFIQGNKIEIAEVIQRGNNLLGRMSFDLGKQGIPYEWFLKFDQFDIRSLGSSFFHLDPRNYAYFTGNWRMKGFLDRWWQSSGQFNIDNIAVKMIKDGINGWKSFKLNSKEPSSIDIGNSQLTIRNNKPLVLSGKDGNISLIIKKSFLPNNLNLNLKGQISSKILKYFIPKLESSKGSIIAEGKIRGSVYDPSFSFTLLDKKVDPFDAGQWDPFAMNFATMPPSINNIKMKVTYIDGILNIEKFYANKGSIGKLQAAGTLDFSRKSSGSSAINIGFNKIDIRRFPISIFTFDNQLSGNLILSGNELPLKITGNLSIDKANSLGNFDIRNQLINSLQGQNINRFRSTDKPVLDLDINLQSNRSIKIRNRNMIAELSASLQIKGSEIEPIVLGTVDINEGKFFYKRDFKITRGSFLFVAANYPPDPKLDIVAEAAINPYIVRITVSGYSSDPRVEMTVDPPIRPDGTPINKMEILLLLAQGKLPSNNSNDDIGNQARQEIMNLAISRFEQPLERLFDMSGQTVVRQIYFDMTSDQNGKPSPRINLPFHFTDDINIIFQVDDDSNIKVSSEYVVHDSISLSWSIDKQTKEETIDENETDGGVDLKFRFRFP